MQIHQSAEDYLETILMLTQRMGKVRSIDVVNELGFTKASVSIAMKKLRENGYIAVDGEGNLTLLEPGREIAERIYSRHRLLTHFFMQLGVDEKTAAEDACKAEHILSEQTLEVIAWPDLGCEAVRRLTVQDMPLTVILDAHGGDLYLEGPAAYRNR